MLAEARPPREAIALHARPDMWGAVGEQAQALAAQLPDALVAELWALLRALDDQTADAVSTAEATYLRATLAHFPGIAPAWWVVYAHVRDGIMAPCANAEGLCQEQPPAA
jgi:hypothetical protein